MKRMLSFFSFPDQVLFNLTSDISAGPIVVDQAKAQFFFVDNNPVAPFIGRSKLNGTNSYSVWNNPIYLYKHTSDSYCTPLFRFGFW